MPDPHRIGLKRLKGARVRYNAIARLRNRDKEKALRAALKRLEREGEKPSEHEITAWDFY